MDLDAFRWLLTDEGQALLEAAAAASEGDELATQRTLRQQSSAEQVAAALTQAGLRRRAEAKFGDLAARMFFTPDGLEQATRLRVAEHRAARLVAASTRDASSTSGAASAATWSPSREAGLTTAGSTSTRCGWPSPRPTSRRSGSPAPSWWPTRRRSTPTPSTSRTPTRHGGGPRTSLVGRRLDTALVLRRAACCGATPCVKVAPGIPHDVIPDGVEAEWVSEGGDVKEAVLWAGGSPRRTGAPP